MNQQKKMFMYYSFFTYPTIEYFAVNIKTTTDETMFPLFLRMNFFGSFLLHHNGCNLNFLSSYTTYKVMKIDLYYFSLLNGIKSVEKVILPVIKKNHYYLSNMFKI